MNEPFEADFIGGPADGQCYVLEAEFPEFRFAMQPEIRWSNFMYSDSTNKLPTRIDYAVYKYIGYGAYLFRGIEHG